MKRLRPARDIMVTRLETVTPETELRDGVRLLLGKRITGAPVVGPQGEYLGMLSEIPCMRALTKLAKAQHGTESQLAAREFMASGLVTLRPEMDAFEAIEMLLKRRISGAPVIDERGNYLGVFSERYSMSLLIQSAYDHWPVTRVGGYLNTDRRRLISEDADLMVVAELFLDSYFRRLPVIRDGVLVGQVSRRDVLAEAEQLTEVPHPPESGPLYLSALFDRDETPPIR